MRCEVGEQLSLRRACSLFLRFLLRRSAVASPACVLCGLFLRFSVPVCGAKAFFAGTLHVVKASGENRRGGGPVVKHVLVKCEVACD